jgi:biopolymer transport protein TolQ
MEHADIMVAFTYAFKSSDLFSKSIMGLLALISIYSWAVMLDKWLIVSAATRMNNKFLAEFRASSNILELVTRLDQFPGGPLVDIYRAGLEEIMDVLQVDPQLIEAYCRRRKLPRELTEREVEKVRATMERTVADRILDLERGVSNISTVVTLSPFLGLLGTVFGITLALSSAAMKGGSMSFSVVGPGISGALLVTGMGLFVAIPALVGYNLVASKLRESVVSMENFVDDFIALLKLQNCEGE